MLTLLNYIFLYIISLFLSRILFVFFMYRKYEKPQYGYVSSSRRNMALQIDLVFLIVFNIFLMLIVNFIVSTTQGVSMLRLFEKINELVKSPIFGILLFVLFFFEYIIYCIIIELSIGNSIGKRFVGISIRTSKGKQLIFPKIILRNCLKIISILTAPGLIFIVYKDRKRQWFHDKFTNSYMMDVEKMRLEDDTN